MNRTALLQERRMQTFQDVLGHWQAGRLSALEAAECCSACNFDPQYHATSIAYRADRRATHAPSNNRRAREVVALPIRIPCQALTTEKLGLRILPLLRRRGMTRLSAALRHAHRFDTKCSPIVCQP